MRPIMETPSENTPSGVPPLKGLPHPNTKRWVVRRKAAVVAAVRTGRITIDEACRVYQLSEEELLSWERGFELYGLAGLRATRIQRNRPSRGPWPATAATAQYPTDEPTR
jgi:hypothetical protein